MFNSKLILTNKFHINSFIFTGPIISRLNPIFPKFYNNLMYFDQQ